MILSIVILALSGFFISLYAFFLEKKVKLQPSYRPFCDISDRYSCTKPILSEYGKLIGISNSFVGMLFYLMMAMLAYFDQLEMLFYFSLASIIMTMYLAYILYFKIKSICIVCHAIYCINIIMFIIISLKYKG